MAWLVSAVLAVNILFLLSADKPRADPSVPAAHVRPRQRADFRPIPTQSRSEAACNVGPARGRAFRFSDNCFAQLFLLNT